jgi:hypothetical protein
VKHWNASVWFRVTGISIFVVAGVWFIIVVLRPKRTEPFRVSPEKPKTAQSDEKTATSNAKAKTGVSVIQSYCEDVDFYLASHSILTRGFVKESNEKGWLETPKPDSDKYENYIFTASVWFRDGEPVIVSLDQSGKSKKPPYHLNLKMYFRPDGTVAKSNLLVDEITKPNHRIVKGKIEYFDAEGKILRSIIATKDMKTKKWSKGADFSRIPIPYYATLTALPFYHLIKNSKDMHMKELPTNYIPFRTNCRWAPRDSTLWTI